MKIMDVESGAGCSILKKYLLSRAWGNFKQEDTKSDIDTENILSYDLLRVVDWKQWTISE